MSWRKSPSPSLNTRSGKLTKSGLLELPIQSEYYSTMPLTLEERTAEAMRLPLESRALLADRLVESLDSAELDDIQRLWTAEAIRRRDEIRSGEAQPIAGEQVLDEVRHLVRR